MTTEHAIEARRQAVQAELDAGRTAAERNRLGQFATPQPLALEIATYMEAASGSKLKRIRFADPSIGTGSFFSAAMSVFGRARIQSAVGVEIDSAFCGAARELWGAEGLEIVRGDFTQLLENGLRPPSPNLILANLPYVRHHHLDRTEKERLQSLTRKLVGIDVNGLAGLYVYFLLLATAWLEEDGYAAWLIPSEFMDVNYGVAVKRFLTERVTLNRIHRFNPDNVQFGDALVSSAIVVFRKSMPPDGHRVAFSFGGTLREPEAKASVALEELREARKWTIYPSHATNNGYDSIRDDGPTLGDFFRIRRGIATGSNKFFILERGEAHRRQLPNLYLRPILPSPRQLKATVIDGDENGYPVLDQQLCLIDCDLPEPVLSERYPSLWNYLLDAEKLGIREGYLVGKRTPWYRQEQREPAPFLCTYMGRGSDEKRPFRFIWNRSRAIGTNLYLMVYPHRGLATLLKHYPSRLGDVYDILGQVTGHQFRGEGRVYGGGLHKIEPSELGRISASTFVERWPELIDGCHQSETASLFG